MSELTALALETRPCRGCGCSLATPTCLVYRLSDGSAPFCQRCFDREEAALAALRSKSPYGLGAYERRVSQFRAAMARTGRSPWDGLVVDGSASSRIRPGVWGSEDRSSQAGVPEGDWVCMRCRGKFSQSDTCCLPAGGGPRLCPSCYEAGLGRADDPHLHVAVDPAASPNDYVFREGDSGSEQPEKPSGFWLTPIPELTDPYAAGRDREIHSGEVTMLYAPGFRPVSDLDTRIAAAQPAADTYDGPESLPCWED